RAAADDEVLGAQRCGGRRGLGDAPELLLERVAVDVAAAHVGRDQLEPRRLEQPSEVAGELQQIAVEQLDAFVADLRDLPQRLLCVPGGHVERILDTGDADAAAVDAAPRDRVAPDPHRSSYLRRPSATAKMMITPWMTSCWLTPKPARISPLLISPIISDPKSAPTTEPLPPKRLVPPRIVAAIAESSSPAPQSKRPEDSRPA